ncbi:unnamed protein product, partial [Strongylus vulgaris]
PLLAILAYWIGLRSRIFGSSRYGLADQRVRTEQERFHLLFLYCAQSFNRFPGPLEMIAERESIYRLLAQVTKDNMNKAINKYTIDPRTRYVSLEMPLQPEDVVQIVSSDNPRMAPISQALVLNNASSVHANPALRKYSLWKFCHLALAPYKLKLYDLDVCWNDGRALAGLVAKFRPSALDYFNVINMQNVND